MPDIETVQVIISWVAAIMPTTLFVLALLDM
jgi:hypothetical protein